jgi:hypothetical protein
MIIGDARVSTTEQNLGLRHDDLKPAFDASVDPTRARGKRATVRRWPSLTSRQLERSKEWPSKQLPQHGDGISRPPGPKALLQSADERGVSKREPETVLHFSGIEGGLVSCDACDQAAGQS